MKLLLGVMVLVSGCGSKKSDSTDKDQPQPKSQSTSGLAPCPKPTAKACNFVHCGGNSMLINAFPVHGTRPDGACNDDKIRLEPKSMEGGGCKGLTLDIDGNKLVGKDGNKKCEGQELVGASFAVSSWKATERIAITEVTEYTAPNGTKFPAYRMEWTKETDQDPAGKRKQLCAKEGQKLRDALGIERMKFSDDIPDDAELVIPIVSEVYDDTGTAVAGGTWNHLACVADALAKRTINGHHDPANPARSRAALRMWTADYCGGRPFTIRGKMFDWARTANLDIEAQWDEHGATCANKPRIVFENGVETMPSKQTKLLKTLCKGCATLQDWITQAKTCTDSLRPDHTLPPCADCTAQDCPLESRHVK